jgi:peroxiredoxin
MSAKATTNSMPRKSKIFKTRWFWGLAILLALGLGGTWIFYSQAVTTGGVTGGDAAALAPAPVAGHPAPDFELKTLAGETVRLSDFAGQPVLVNFWATWCGPCRAEFPDFQEASLANADRLVIIGINNTTTDRVDLVDDFVAEMGATFPIVLDEDGKVSQTYQIRGLPTSIFIDRNGMVNEVFTGPINKAYIEAKLNEL